MTATSAAWHDLGRQLVARRLALNPDYRNRRTFCDAAGMEYRIISDIENGRRSNYAKTTLRAIEQAYRLQPGSIDRFVAQGGPLAPVDTGPSSPSGQASPLSLATIFSQIENADGSDPAMAALRVYLSARDAEVARLREEKEQQASELEKLRAEVDRLSTQSDNGDTNSGHRDSA